MYRIIRKIIIFISSKILFRVKFENEEIVKKYDKCLICPNHSRIFDPIWIYPKLSNIHIMAKSELFKRKKVASFLTFCGAFPVDRDNNDATALRKALKLIKTNEKINLLLFPEGKVLKTKEERGIVKEGAVYIASMAEVPIIPVYITARPKYFSRVIIRFGEPIYYDKTDLKDREKAMQNSKKLLEEIYKLEK